MQEKVLILFHKSDNDGVCSAAIIYNAICDEIFNKEDIDLRDIDYNEISLFDKSTLDDLRSKYSKLIMTDISFPIQLMEYAWKIWGEDLN